MCLDLISLDACAEKSGTHFEDRTSTKTWNNPLHEDP